MSVLVMCRNLDPELDARAEHIAVAALGKPASYLEALAAWGVPDPGSWHALTAWDGRSWGDLVNGALCDPAGKEILVRALDQVVRGSDEAAIWYAGFPDDVPTVSTPAAFEAVLRGQLAANELEPAVRMSAARSSE